MNHPCTCAFCRNDIDKSEKVKVTTTETGTLKFYHVTPDCFVTEKMLQRLKHFAETVHERYL